MSEDREGDALDREIAADRRELAERRRRRVLFVPPLLALAVTAWALGVSRPREVLGARVIAGPKPPAGAPLHVRVQVLAGIPGVEGVRSVEGLELRAFDNGARGRAERTDDRGVAEVVIDPPLPTSPITIEARGGNGFQPIGVLAIGALAEPDPRHGLLETRRHTATIRGELRVEVAAELGALASPIPGAAWIRVTTSGGAPVRDARLTLTAEGGLANEFTPTTTPTVTDAAGLARVALTPIAAPVVLTVTAEHGGSSGVFSGMIGTVLGAAIPRGDGKVAAGSKTIELLNPSSRATTYVDLWHSGVRIAGGRVTFANGVGSFPLPPGLTGVIDVETSSSPLPASADDLAHLATWPLVVATDDVDAWGAVATSPRIPEHLAPGGTLAGYGRAAVASLAFAKPAAPPRKIVSDGLPAALHREARRARDVRTAATFAMVGGGLVELGLMLFLGVFGSGPTVAEAMRASGDEIEETEPAPPSRRRWGGLVVTGVGIVALVFAALATMVRGMP